MNKGMAMRCIGSLQGGKKNKKTFRIGKHVEIQQWVRFVRQCLSSTRICLGQDLQVLKSQQLSGRLQNLCHENTFADSLSHCDSSQNSSD